MNCGCCNCGRPCASQANCQGGMQSNYTSAQDIKMSLLFCSVICVGVALYYLVLSVAFVLTSPGALVSVLWTSVCDDPLPVIVVWKIGYATFLAMAILLFAILRNAKTTTITLVLISLSCMLIELEINVRPFAFGEVVAAENSRTRRVQTPPPSSRTRTASCQNLLDRFKVKL